MWRRLGQADDDVCRATADVDNRVQVSGEVRTRLSTYSWFEVLKSAWA